jgi:hypothetical protein
VKQDIGSSFRDIKAVISDLQLDLLFNLMASDKELFHSNVHAQIFVRNPRIKEAFFSKFSAINSEQTKSLVLREYKHIDLFMQHPKYYPLAIENKLFADLGDGQLARYTEALKALKSDWYGILLTLKALNMESISDTVKQKWTLLTYREFASFLNENTGIIDAENFEKEFLLRYIKLIEKLDLLASMLLPSNTDPRLELSLPMMGKMETSINKMRYRMITEEIRRGLHSDLKLKSYQIDYGISHSRPFLELEFFLNNHNGLGWQYQEGQFRLFARCNSLNGKGLHEARTKYALSNYREWFDFTRIEHLLPKDFVIRPIDPERLLKFDPNFVYRYAKTTELTIDNLLEISRILAERVNQYLQEME